jgi:hypothetical protein
MYPEKTGCRKFVTSVDELIGDALFGNPVSAEAYPD